MELADLTATEAAELIRNAQITSEELVQACIERIEQLEPTVQAWTHFDPELALEQARARDRQRVEGFPIGPLHGVPVALKDIIDTRNWPTENGTVLDSGREPTEDASIVHFLIAAGAVLMGKTVTTELAYFGPGKTQNPHNTEHTPGGSSSGSAAAVACGMVPLAIGSQTNGSVIRPASFCGVFGFKPTHGRISRKGMLMLSRFLDHVGVFARSLNDVALLSDVLMQYDHGDADMVPSAPPAMVEVSSSEPPVDPKFIFVKTAIWDQVADDARQGLEELVKDLGISCDEIGLPPIFEHATDYLGTVMSVDMAYNLADYAHRGLDKLSAPMQAILKKGADTPGVEYLRARDMRGKFTDLFIDHVFEEGDVIITPSTLGEAPKGLDATGDPAANSLWTLCGLPSLTVPLLAGANDLPIGVQLVGRPGDDARLLRASRWLTDRLSELDAAA